MKIQPITHRIIELQCGELPDNPAQFIEEDPYQTPEYQAFVASMVPHCHCSERNRPCDGLLAGGPCDGINDDDECEEAECDDEDDEY